MSDKKWIIRIGTGYFAGMVVSQYHTDTKQTSGYSYAAKIDTHEHAALLVAVLKQMAPGIEIYKEAV